MTDEPHSTNEPSGPFRPDPEGPECEWKERLPLPGRVARTLAAFANGVGGKFLVGVRDDGAVVGTAEPVAVADELRRIAREHVAPPLELVVDRIPASHGPVVRAVVAPCDDRPVVARGRDGEWAPFVRDGASTRRASRETVRAWARDRRATSLDPKARRVLREVREHSRFDAPGPTVPEIARLARVGSRTAKRIVVALEQQGLVTDRGGGRFGLTPEGHRRARR